MWNQGFNAQPEVKWMDEKPEKGWKGEKDMNLGHGGNQFSQGPWKVA